MARYREIADDLRAKIRSGYYPVGSKLPSISELQEEYQVSGLNTIRAAQQLLAGEQMVEAQQGVGVFVIAVESARQLDIPAALAGVSDALTAVLAALEAQAKHKVTFDLETDDDTSYVLIESLREFADRRRGRSEDGRVGGGRQLQLAKQAEAMIRLVEKA
jgi:DNA-binding GntR family transcriptional regulator